MMPDLAKSGIIVVREVRGARETAHTSVAESALDSPDRGGSPQWHDLCCTICSEAMLVNADLHPACTQSDAPNGSRDCSLPAVGLETPFPMAFAVDSP